MYLGRLAAGSQRAQRGALETIARLVSNGQTGHLEFPWHQMAYQHTQAVRAQLDCKYAPATTNRMLAALKGCLQEAWRLELMPAEQYRKAVDLRPVRGSTEPKGRALAVSELRRLLEACVLDPRPAGRRDAAMLAVLCSTGLRRSEVVALEIGDFDTDLGELKVKRGKGRKARTGYITGEWAELLGAWLQVRGELPGPLFLPINRGGGMTMRALSSQSVLDILARRAEAAGIIRRFAPHDMRRTFITRLLEAGVDVGVVQQLAGHSNVQTTLKYDRRGDQAKKRAAGLLGL